jgi:hypothetical protein
VAVQGWSGGARELLSSCQVLLGLNEASLHGGVVMGVE